MEGVVGETGAGAEVHDRPAELLCLRYVVQPEKEEERDQELHQKVHEHNDDELVHAVAELALQLTGAAGLVGVLLLDRVAEERDQHQDSTEADHRVGAAVARTFDVVVIVDPETDDDSGERDQVEVVDEVNRLPRHHTVLQRSQPLHGLRERGPRTRGGLRQIRGIQRHGFHPAFE